MKRLLFILFVISISITGFSQDPVAIFGKPWEQLTREQRRFFWEKRTIRAFEPSGKPTLERIDDYIRIYMEKNIFDPKVTVFDVRAEEKGGTITLTGEVLFPRHKSGLERVFGILGFDKIENNIDLLPESSLFPKAFGVVIPEAASIKRSPMERSEQVNQVLKDGPVRLLKRHESGKFFLVQGPDAYIGWMDSENIRRMTLVEWIRHRKIERDDSASRKKILDIAAPIMGIPYVWGGITEEGMDCSGLTQYIYRKRGLFLPRDADEQSNIGELVAFPGYMQNLRAGDLLLFCGGSGRISHVAISLGGADYLQSSGKPGVHLSSFDPDSEYYDDRTAEKFIFARRILRDGF